MRGSLAWKTSFLFKNRIMLVLKNHRELTTPSNRSKDSFKRFYTMKKDVREKTGEQGDEAVPPATFLLAILDHTR